MNEQTNKRMSKNNKNKIEIYANVIGSGVWAKML
jgi:hypothetical protein